MEKIRENASKAFSLDGFFVSNPFLFTVNGTRFTLKKKIYYNNSFVPIFDGEVLPSGSGSEIRGHFRMPVFTTVFMGFWMTFACVGVIGIFLQNLTKGFGAGSNWMEVLFSLALPLFGFFLIKSGQWLARSHEPAILGYLESCAK